MIRGKTNTSSRIKKAYRRKALELHPDRNYGDVNRATKLFAEIQSAYQVLSDPQERAWYDSHREAILRDVDVGSSDHFEHNVRVTTVTELSSLMGKFKTTIPFTDAANGFYGKLRLTFETLAEEEYAACDWEGVASVDYPTFGTSESSYEDVVKPFYAVWTSFSTRKTFSWKDKHNYAEAPDRYVRRLMEKENKRFREDGIREFNDAVRTLVMFVRKRDPRYAANVQTEAERQKALKEAAAAQAARARAAQQAKVAEHVTPAWAQTVRTDQDGTFSESEVSEEEVIECVTCDKIFKSEKQYEAHEKSKKHIKAVQHLTRKMRKENKVLDLENLSAPAESSSQSASQDGEADDAEPTDIVDVAPVTEKESSVEESRVEHDSKQDVELKSASSTSEDDINHDEYAPREVVEKRVAGEPETAEILGTVPISTTDNIDILSGKLKHVALSDDDNSDWANTSKKKGKAKGKRAKKTTPGVSTPAEKPVKKEKMADEVPQHTCAVCNEVFPSKNKLFDHIKAEDHAQYVPQQGKGKKGKKSKK